MHIRNPVEWILNRFETPSELGDAPPAQYWPTTYARTGPKVNKITNADLTEALRRGWHDFGAARTDLIIFWLIYPVVAVFIAAADAWGQVLPLLFPVASGFVLVGPFFAVGLYEMSRQRELTGKTRWRDAFGVWHSPAIGSIAALGLGLMVLYLAWIAVAWGIYDATLGPKPPASVLSFISDIFTTGAGWAMIVCGLAAGAMFAVVALALSVVSFPLLLDRPADVRLAVRTSVEALLRNPGPLGLWGVIVAGGLALGALPCFIGLIVVLPVLGHATWHLYRRVVS